MTKKILPFIFIIAILQSVFAFDKSVQKELVVSAFNSKYLLDPYLSDTTNDADVLINLYEGLFTFNPYTFSPEPALIESFKIERDKKTWVFTLKDKLCYSDGSPITASEIKRSWLKALSPDTHSSFGSLLDVIAGAEEYRTGRAASDKVSITAKDDKTLVVKLKSPAQHFASILCHVCFAAIPEQKGVYSGAYILEQKTKTQITLKKNDFFYDAQNVAIPSVKYLLSNDAAQNTFDYNLGTTNWISGNVNLSQVYDMQSIYLNAGFSTFYFFFKCKNEPWNNSEVRRALLLAIPWEELRSESQIEANTLILPISNDYPELEGLWETNLEEAKEILNEQLTQSQIENATLDIYVIDDYLSTAQILQSAWEELGIDLDIITDSSSDYFEKVSDIDFDVCVYNWVADFPDPIAFLELFRKGSSLNVTAWESEEYENFLTEAGKTQETSERYKFLGKAEDVLLNDSVIIPVEHGIFLNVVDTSILAGWIPNALDIHPVRFMYFLPPPDIEGVI